MIKNDISIGSQIYAELDNGESVLGIVSYVMDDAFFVEGRTNLILYSNIQKFAVNPNLGGQSYENY